MTEKFSKKYSLMFGDMDINYHMTKMAVAKYFQETFARFCAKHNLAAFDVLKDGIIWVVSDLRAEILNRLPMWSEEFTVRVWISETTKMRTYIEFEIVCHEKIVAKGESCFYMLDEKTRRPIKSMDLVKPFGLIDEKVFGEHTKQNYEISGEKISEKIHEVTVRDLDFNYHVNNLSYIGISFETAPSDFLEKNEITSYSIQFLQETRLGDKLGCELYLDGNKIISRIYNMEDEKDVCLAWAKYRERNDFCRNPREAGVDFE
ncbi:MAG: thioesterase [bacterium]|nr:thioesterase [bacterium]